MFAAQSIEESGQVGGKRRFEVLGLVRDRVDESQFGGVQREPGRAAILCARCLSFFRPVDFVAAQRMTLLGKVNPDLMGSPGLEPAFNQGVAGERFERSNVRYGPFALCCFRRFRAPSASVAAIANQHAFNRHRIDIADDDGEIAASDRVLRELMDQRPFGFHIPGKDHQAASIAVEPMDGPNPGRRRGLFGSLSFGDDSIQAFFECGLFLAAIGGPESLLGVPERRHSRGFFDDDQMLIQKTDLDVVFFGRRSLGMGKNVQHVGGFQAATRIDAQISIDVDATRGDQLPGLSPRNA